MLPHSGATERGPAGGGGRGSMKLSPQCHGEASLTLGRRSVLCCSWAQAESFLQRCVRASKFG